MKYRLTQTDKEFISSFFDEWLLDNRDYDFSEEPELKTALIHLGVLNDDELDDTETSTCELCEEKFSGFGDVCAECEEQDREGDRTMH